MASNRNARISRQRHGGVLYPLRDLFFNIQIHAQSWTPMVPWYLCLLLILDLGTPIYSLSPPVWCAEDCSGWFWSTLRHLTFSCGEDYHEISAVSLQIFLFVFIDETANSCWIIARSVYRRFSLSKVTGDFRAKLPVRFHTSLQYEHTRNDTSRWLAYWAFFREGRVSFSLYVIICHNRASRFYHHSPLGRFLRSASRVKTTSRNRTTTRTYGHPVLGQKRLCQNKCLWIYNDPWDSLSTL